MDVQNFDGTVFFLGSNGQKKFQIPLADRATFSRAIFLFFTSFKSYAFLKFVKKYTHCHFVDNNIFVMIFIEVLAL